jgi:hypothetical protein
MGEKYKVRYTVEGGFHVTIHSHKQADKIRRSLGIDPNIHSGMAGVGKSVCVLTQEEFDRLKGEGVKISKRRT